jgi:hypothetical protein
MYRGSQGRARCLPVPQATGELLAREGPTESERGLDKGPLRTSDVAGGQRRGQFVVPLLSFFPLLPFPPPLVPGSEHNQGGLSAASEVRWSSLFCPTRKVPDGLVQVRSGSGSCFIPPRAPGEPGGEPNRAADGGLGGGAARQTDDCQDRWWTG